MGKPFVSLQLYTVRDFAEQNIEDALRKIKEIGYDYVELAGLYGMEPEKLRKLLDEIGLCAISAHVQFKELAADTAGAIAVYKALGCEYIVIPMLPLECLPGGSEYEETKAVVEKFCDTCNEAGVIPLYHNHAHEFEKLTDNLFKLDKFFEDIPALKAQLDTGWIKAARQDPIAYIKKYAGRCPIVHLKDTFVNSYNGYEDRPVGKGSQNIPETISIALATGTVGFVAELDKTVGMTSIEAADESRKYLQSLGY